MNSNPDALSPTPPDDFLHAESMARRGDFERLLNAFGIRAYRDDPLVQALLLQVRAGHPAEEVLIAGVKGLLIANKSLQTKLYDALVNQPTPIIFHDRPQHPGT